MSGPDGEGETCAARRVALTQPSLHLSAENCTVLVLRMAHRIWKETKQEPDTAEPGNMLLLSFFPFPVGHPEHEHYTYSLEGGSPRGAGVGLQVVEVGVPEGRLEVGPRPVEPRPEPLGGISNEVEVQRVRQSE